AILKLANATRTPLVPQGGNTGLVGGQIPHEGEIVLSLRRLDKIREVDATSNAMTCEAGTVLVKAQEAAAAADRLFPLSLGAEGSCTIGGNLSTNAGGTAALTYGIARDLVVGLEVVLADGRVMHTLSKLKKDNTGYDLKDLFVGAEGTLGIITAAVLKLFPPPRGGDRLCRRPLAARRARAPQPRARAHRRHGDELRAHLPRHPRLRAQARPWLPRSARERVSLVRADRGLLADAERAAHFARRGAGNRHRALTARRRGDRRKPRSDARLLAPAPFAARGAEARGRLDQARHLGAGRRGAGFPRRGRRRGRSAHSRRAAGAVRPSRRRQHALQRVAADWRRQAGVPGT